MHIAIGIPTHGEIKCDTVTSLLSLSLPSPTTFFFARGTYVHKNRNQIVEWAKNSNSTHLMFIDSDMIFPSNGIQTLLDRDKDIIGGLYYRREMPLRYTIELNEEGDVPSEPFTCKSIGTGFLLIKMEVFEELKKPYFFFEVNKDGNMVGEDVYFCHKAIEAGIDIWCDPTIKIAHVGDFAY